MQRKKGEKPVQAGPCLRNATNALCRTQVRNFNAEFVRPNATSSSVRAAAKTAGNPLVMSLSRTPTDVPAVADAPVKFLSRIIGPCSGSSRDQIAASQLPS